MTFLTTVRRNTNGVVIDITIHNDGSVAKTIGATEDIFKARRWERHILLHWREWTNALLHKSLDRTNILLRAMYDECKTDHHVEWLAAHPLPEVPA
jgi:hypothetical protein